MPHPPPTWSRKAAAVSRRSRSVIPTHASRCRSARDRPVRLVGTTVCTAKDDVHPSTTCFLAHRWQCCTRCRRGHAKWRRCAAGPGMSAPSHASRCRNARDRPVRLVGTTAMASCSFLGMAVLSTPANACASSLPANHRCTAPTLRAPPHRPLPSPHHLCITTANTRVSVRLTNPPYTTNNAGRRRPRGLTPSPA